MRNPPGDMVTTTRFTFQNPREPRIGSAGPAEIIMNRVVGRLMNLLPKPVPKNWYPVVKWFSGSPLARHAFPHFMRSELTLFFHAEGK